jgi:Mlc titration factor MtfA (ptsG expression regulator)
MSLTLAASRGTSARVLVHSVDAARSSRAWAAGAVVDYWTYIEHDSYTYIHYSADNIISGK